jgi:hypothetical protein
MTTASRGRFRERFMAVSISNFALIVTFELSESVAVCLLYILNIGLSQDP